MPLLLSFHEKDFEPLLWIEYLDFGFGTALLVERKVKRRLSGLPGGGF